MKDSGISWTTHTWNPVTGCTEVSEGCDHCYAKLIAENKRGTPAFPNGFDVQLRPHKLRDPLKWKTPAKIFVNSMSDLFHREIPDDYLRQIWDTMVEADWHVYQILTKRAHRGLPPLLGQRRPAVDREWWRVRPRTPACSRGLVPGHPGCV